MNNIKKTTRTRRQALVLQDQGLTRNWVIATQLWPGDSVTESRASDFRPRSESERAAFGFFGGPFERRLIEEPGLYVEVRDSERPEISYFVRLDEEDIIQVIPLPDPNGEAAATWGTQEGVLRKENAELRKALEEAESSAYAYEFAARGGYHIM